MTLNTIDNVNFVEDESVLSQITGGLGTTTKSTLSPITILQDVGKVLIKIGIALVEVGQSKAPTTRSAPAQL